MYKSSRIRKNTHKSPTTETEIIMHSCDSILLHNSHIWSKSNVTNKNDLFHIGTGSFHGAEIGDLVGLYILGHLKSVFTGNNKKIRMSRDGGLALISISTARLIYTHLEPT